MIPESLRIKFSNLKILDVLLFEFFQPPDEGYLIRSRHIVGNFLEYSIWFNSWMFQKISINRSNFVRLANLYGNLIKITNNSFHSISSVNHSKIRSWISFLSHCPKESLIVFQSFLKDVFWSQNISSDSILSYKYSPLGIRALLSEESCIENENGRGIGWEVGIYTKLCNPFHFFSKLGSQSSMNCANRNFVVFW